MRTKILVGSVAIILGAIGMSGQAQKPAAPALITSAAAEKAFFSQYCYGCHNQAAKARGVESALRLTLDSLDPAHVEQNPETFEKVVRKLRAGMMPPSGMPRPNRRSSNPRSYSRKTSSTVPLSFIFLLLDCTA